MTCVSYSIFYVVKNIPEYLGETSSIYSTFEDYKEMREFYKTNDDYKFPGYYIVSFDELIDLILEGEVSTHAMSRELDDDSLFAITDAIEKRIG